MERRELLGNVGTLIGSTLFGTPKSKGTLPNPISGPKGTLQTLLYTYSNPATAATNLISVALQVVTFSQDVYFRKIVLSGSSYNSGGTVYSEVDIHFNAVAGSVGKLGAQPYSGGALGTNFNQPGTLSVYKNKAGGTLVYPIDKDPSLMVPANTPITINIAFRGPFALNDLIVGQVSVTFEM